ncbi:MAG: NADH-quinone oxidoreductase subunit L [Candidatus Dasytiphilus stammeri]
MNIVFLSMVFPLLGFLLLAFSCGRWSERVSSFIGTTSVGLAAIVTIFVNLDFFYHSQRLFEQKLWSWIRIDNFLIDINLRLDGLSLTMLSIVTGVGFLVHLFSYWYMRGEEGSSRYFAYTNLFIASMIVLVLADNLLLMYLGWELVGLCSYLLIGFYYTNVKNVAAALKAFIITRFGDVCLLISLFIIYNEIGSLNFHDIDILASAHLSSSSVFWATLLLLCGAIGKSAQLPLQTWLADAMVGPAPVSALIHSATMVTAGVYLIARTHILFLLMPEVLHFVGIIGAMTLIFAGCAALVQIDIKRVLAYSTMSQIGYMFLALSVHAWNAAIVHLMIHAFFKALLFLASGVLIVACRNEQNIFKMGGLRKEIPQIYICFLIGGASLAAFPLVTAGFFSKEEILLSVFYSGHINLLIAGLLGTLITSLYTFRMIFMVFHGKPKIAIHKFDKVITYQLPLLVLVILSTFIGYKITPQLQLDNVFPIQIIAAHKEQNLLLELITSGIVILGILISTVLWSSRYSMVNYIAYSTIGRFLNNWWFQAWGFDCLYKKLFVKTYLRMALLLHRDPLNMLMNLPANFLSFTGRNLLKFDNGYLHCYITSLIFGAVIILALMIML